MRERNRCSVPATPELGGEFMVGGDNEEKEITLSEEELEN